MLGTARLGAAYRVAADEAARAACRLAHRAFGGADVGDGARLGARLEHRARLGRKLRDRRSDHGEVGLGESSGE